MCYNCGCFNPQDNMGSDENITESTFDELSKKWNKSLEETKKTVLSMLKEKKVSENPELFQLFQKASKAWGQSADVAQKNAQDFLEQEVG